MTIEVTGKRVALVLAGVVLVLVGAAMAARSLLHPHVDARTDLHADVLRQPGLAPADVQAGVRAALRAFQDGYVRRDPGRLDAFMNELFANGDDVLLLGTGPSEWSRGFAAATEFVRRDWAYWGDFRFGVDDAIISSSSDTAWIATMGTVHYKKYDRPVRLTAVLTRRGDKWVFRQMEFQYEDSGVSGAGLVLMGR